LWTPITPEIVELLNMAKVRSGMSWSLFCRHVGMRERVVRRYRTSGKNAGTVKRHRRRVAIPMSHLDRILSFGKMNHRVEDFEWYTVDQLVELGIWQPMATKGGSSVEEAPFDDLDE
jgi:hypothetical protein